MLNYTKILAALGIGLVSMFGYSDTTRAQQNAVTAIDIALEPDATMIQHAQADNARLLKAYPKGFALDATHNPHVTLLQQFVRTADLDKVYAAANKALAGENPDCSGVCEYRGRPRHPGVLNRLRGQFCVDRIGPEIQSARHNWCRDRSLPEGDACGTVRGVHVLASVSVGLPAWHFWYGSKGTQGLGVEALNRRY